MNLTIIITDKKSVIKYGMYIKCNIEPPVFYI